MKSSAVALTPRALLSIVKVRVDTSPAWIEAGAKALEKSGRLVSLAIVSVWAPLTFPAASVSVTDRVSVPSPRPDTSIPAIWSAAPPSVPLPATFVPPPLDEIV